MLYEAYFDEINAELAQMAAIAREEESTSEGEPKRIYIGSGEDGGDAHFKTITVI